MEGAQQLGKQSNPCLVPEYSRSPSTSHKQLREIQNEWKTSQSERGLSSPRLLRNGGLSRNCGTPFCKSVLEGCGG